MRVQYFSDTDTLYIILNDNFVSETRDLDENTILDLDEHGNLTSLTIEHAQTRVKISSFSFEQISTNTASIPSLAKELA